MSTIGTSLHSTASRTPSAHPPLVSIVVPFFNAEATLSRLLDSLLSQSYSNIEVILVDDGSTDSSLDIARHYSQQHSNVRFFSHPQRGVSHSRNVGMAMAQGTYLQFADADDWLETNCVERFVSHADSSGCDMVISDFYRIRSKRCYHMGVIEQEGLYSRKDFAEEMMRSPADFYYGVVWNKFFRLELIRAHQLEFSDHLDWCEDFQFNLEYLQYASTIYVLKEPLYCYVKNKGSLSSASSIRGKVVKTKLELFQYYKELYQSLDLYEQNKVRVHAFLIAVAKERGHRDRPQEQNSQVIPAPLPKCDTLLD